MTDDDERGRSTLEASDLMLGGHIETRVGEDESAEESSSKTLNRRRARY